MALDNILVAIDFSAQSTQALAQAVAIAQRTGGALLLLWVDDRATASAPVYGTAVEEVEQLVSDLHAESATRLGDLADQAASQGVRASYRIVNGQPDEVIVHTAEAQGADLIVTGTKGLTGFRRFFLGSVAEKVLRLSTTNMMVARGASTRFRRILVPTDFSPAGEKAMALAGALAEPGAEPEVTIDVFHAWQYPSGTHGMATADPRSGPFAALRDQIVARNAAEGSAMVQRHAHPDRNIRFVQEFGAPAASIQERLERERYDLVVMGTHGYRGFRRFLLGSVAEATVRHAPCSVLVAHAGDVPAAEDLDQE